MSIQHQFGASGLKQFAQNDPWIWKSQHEETICHATNSLGSLYKFKHHQIPLSFRCKLYTLSLYYFVFSQSFPSSTQIQTYSNHINISTSISDHFSEASQIQLHQSDLSTPASRGCTSNSMKCCAEVCGFNHSPVRTPSDLENSCGDWLESSSLNYQG